MQNDTTLTLDQRLAQAVEYVTTEVLKADLINNPTDWEIVSDFDTSKYAAQDWKPYTDGLHHYIYVLCVPIDKPVARLYRKAVSND